MTAASLPMEAPGPSGTVRNRPSGQRLGSIPSITLREEVGALAISRSSSYRGVSPGTVLQFRLLRNTREVMRL